MEMINDLWESINGYINIPYLFTFMLLSYAVKSNFGDWLKANKFKTVYVVLILATVIAVPYALLADVGWSELLFTYTLGTSLHELFFKVIETKLNPKKR